MASPVWDRDELDPEIAEAYRHALKVLTEAQIPFLVGGGYALEVYTGIRRKTKDLDIFAIPNDVKRILAILGKAGYQTELTSPHWLAKARWKEHLIDIIFNSGNALCRVDASWFDHAVSGVFLDLPVQLCPVEETIWQKAFVMERDRFDGADIAHLLKACGSTIDWDRLLERFGPHWRVLFCHLLLFGYIYPGERSVIPVAVMQELVSRFQQELFEDSPAPRICRGTLLSSLQYLFDVEHSGYEDARLQPGGPMTPLDVAHWKAELMEKQCPKKTDVLKEPDTKEQQPEKPSNSQPGPKGPHRA